MSTSTDGTLRSTSSAVPPLRRRHVAHDVGRSVRLDLHLLALRGDRLRLQFRSAISVKRDDADVNVGMRAR